MFIVLVKWKIKPGQETTFLDHWQKTLKIADERGLVGEFLCTPENHEYASWRLPDLDDPPCAIFLNVGIWENESSFLDQVSRYFNDEKTLLPFEARRRVRTFLGASAWRMGAAHLPNTSSEGVD